MASKLVIAISYILWSTFVVDGRQLPISGTNEDTLELAHVIFRHGDRTPDRNVLYPNDPHVNATYYPVGFGQLTNAGKRKEYILGKSLHKRYSKFLGLYNIDNVDARCTDYNRTKMSLQLVLASLFPPEHELVWEKHLKWQPIPFNYWAVKDDHVLGYPTKNCPRFEKLYEEFSRSDEGLSWYKQYENISSYIAKHAGIAMTGASYAELYFTLATEIENGLELPSWTNEIYPDTARNLAILDYMVATGSQQLKRLSSGFLFKKIISDSRRKIRGFLNPSTKLFLYSAHEHNLAHLLRFLNIYYPHVPPYGAYILIEIHKVKGIRGVKVFYQDYHTAKPKRMKIPNCDYFCRFEKFVSLYKNLIPDGEDECFI